MKIPPGKTEEQVLEAIEKVVAILAPSFVFGYYGVEDIKQCGRMHAIEILGSDKYDPSRPLENFLYRAVQNHLINLIRNKFRRSEPSCVACHQGSPCGEDGQVCKKYLAWVARNKDKASLVQPLDLSNISDEKERRTRRDSTIVNDAEISEMLAIIDAELPLELRASYLQMQAGVSISKARRLQVEDAVRDILNGGL